MKRERLFKILGQIDTDLVEAADGKKLSKVRKTLFVKVGAIAACSILAVGIGVVIHQNNLLPPVVEPPPTSAEESNLPMLSIDFETGTMGFEGYCAYQIDELVSENPWSEDSKITHLPVMKNTLVYNGLERVENSDLEAMKVLLKETASRLGMDTEHLPITDDIPNEETKKKITEKFDGKVPDGYFDISRVYMQDQNIKVEVDTAMVVKVDFEPAVSLPAELNFTHNASYEEIYEVAAYLKDEYKEYIAMENPKINVTGGHYTFDGNQMYLIEFFDDTGDETQKLLNYNFNRVTFGCDDDGKLFISRTYRPNLTDVIGNYPIISEQEALDLLENKNYITTVPEAFPGGEYVRKLELVYRNGSKENTYMPYYRIYVEIPSMKIDNGLNTYGAYYVPAVEGKYIGNMPVWDGGFN